jgi:hypothetical protein
MGGPVGRELIRRFNLFVNALIPAGQRHSRWINQVVNSAAQRIGVHPRKLLATANEFGRVYAGMRERA